MSGGRIPLAFGTAAAVADRRRTALVLTRGGADGSGFALVRHADAAARAQAGACACCRAPSDLATVLRQLIIDRARGIDFAAVLVDGDAPSLARMAEDALADPLVAARYVVTHRPRNER